MEEQVKHKELQEEEITVWSRIGFAVEKIEVGDICMIDFKTGRIRRRNLDLEFVKNGSVQRPAV